MDLATNCRLMESLESRVSLDLSDAVETWLFQKHYLNIRAQFPS